MKKGISPLISTVLLILFVITVLIVIFRFTGEKVEESFEKGYGVLEGFSNCDEVEFKLLKVECEADRGNVIGITISNEKKMSFIDGFSARIFYKDGSMETVTSFVDNNLYLAPYEAKTLQVSRTPFEDLTNPFGNKQYKAIKEVEVLPKVPVGDEFKFCQEKKQKIDAEGCEKLTL